MVEFEELRLRLLGSSDGLKQLAQALGLDSLKKEIETLEQETAREDFWGDLENSQKVLQKISVLKGKVKKYEDLENSYNDAL